MGYTGVNGLGDEVWLKDAGFSDEKITQIREYLLLKGAGFPDAEIDQYQRNTHIKNIIRNVLFSFAIPLLALFLIRFLYNVSIWLRDSFRYDKLKEGG